MTNAYNPGSQFRPRSPYGWRIDPLHDNKEEFHAGQDFAAPAGTPIPAAGSGTVVYSGLNKGFGNVVIIKNDAGLQVALSDHGISGHLCPGHDRTAAWSQQRMVRQGPDRHHELVCVRRVCGAVARW